MNHIKTREPGGSAEAEKLRNLIIDMKKNSSLNMEAEFMLLSAARAQHVKDHIKPNLEAGVSVLTDRFIDSSIVYQGFVGGLSLETIRMVNQLCTYNLVPDLTFLLDIDVEKALGRLGKREDSGGIDAYDQADKNFHIKVRNSFLTLAQQEKSRFYVLNSEKKPSVLCEEAFEIITRKLLV